MWLVGQCMQWCCKKRVLRSLGVLRLMDDWDCITIRSKIWLFRKYWILRRLSVSCVMQSKLLRRIRRLRKIRNNNNPLRRKRTVKVRRKVIRRRNLQLMTIRMFRSMMKKYWMIPVSTPRKEMVWKCKISCRRPYCGNLRIVRGRICTFRMPKLRKECSWYSRILGCRL